MSWPGVVRATRRRTCRNRWPGQSPLTSRGRAMTVLNRPPRESIVRGRRPNPGSAIVSLFWPHVRAGSDAGCRSARDGGSSPCHREANGGLQGESKQVQAARMPAGLAGSPVPARTEAFQSNEIPHFDRRRTISGNTSTHCGPAGSIRQSHAPHSMRPTFSRRYHENGISAFFGPGRGRFRPDPAGYATDRAPATRWFLGIVSEFISKPERFY